MKKPLSLFLAFVVVLATIPFVGVANAMVGVELTPGLGRSDMAALNNPYTYSFDQGGSITIQVLQNTPESGTNTIYWSTTGVALTQVTIKSSGNTIVTATYDPASYGPNSIIAGKNQIHEISFWGIPDQAPTYTVSYEPGTQGTFAAQTTTGLELGDPTPAAPTVTGNPGYTFAGWNPTPSLTVTGDATYTAQWTQDQYTVTYAPGTQGTFAPQVTSGLVYGDITPSAPTPTGNPGYTFAGWNPAPTATVTATVTYTAQWTQNQYTVTYAPGTQGTFTAQATSGLVYGDTTPSAPTPTGNPGYTFAGWNPAPTATVTGTVTYTAQWSGQLYTVTYAPGTQGTFTAQVTSGLAYGATTPAAPEATPGNPGYTFAGWSPEPAETVTGDATYTAQWTQNQYTVTYAPGTQGTFTAQVTSGLVYGDSTPVAPEATPGNPGYTFNGWSPEPAETVTGDATYTAQWTQNQYTVTYAPGTQGTFTAQVTSGLVYGDSTPVAPEATPGNPGYTFNGWSPEPAETVTGDTTYTAQWTQNQYTVTYAPGAQGTFAPQVTSGLVYGDSTPVAPEATPGNPGYTFAGWSPEPAALVTGNATYTAQWTPVIQPTTYTVTYQPGTQGTFAMQSTSGLLAGVATPTPPAATGNSGFSFVGWTPTWSATVAGNATYTAMWSPIVQPVFYTVTYAPGAQGTFIAQINSGLSFGATTPAAPAVSGNEGFTFIGWSPAVTTTVTETITYTAQWEAVPAPIFYDVVADAEIGGSATGGGTFLAGSTATVIATPENGYDFLGWEENGVVVSTSLVYSFEVDRDYDLLATFELELDDPIIPEAPELPETGELPFTIFYGIGALISAAGIAVGKKRRARS